MTSVDLSRLPEHVAIIMDGNGRWAQQLGQERTVGHRRGSDAVRRIVRASRRLGIRALTLYAFSEQNWARPEDEVSTLMTLLHDFLVSERDEILSNSIRLRAIGRLNRLPPHVRSVLDELSRTSSPMGAMTLTLALSYGGKEEIADAARELARAACAGEIDPEVIDEQLLERALPSMEVGPVDLLIRTGGETRISNFLLWGSAYAELFFTEALWPDFEVADLYRAIASYQSRDRRYGRVNAASSPCYRSEPTPQEARPPSGSLI